MLTKDDVHRRGDTRHAIPWPSPNNGIPRIPDGHNVDIDVNVDSDVDIKLIMMLVSILTFT